MPGEQTEHSARQHPLRNSARLDHAWIGVVAFKAAESVERNQADRAVAQNSHSNTSLMIGFTRQSFRGFISTDSTTDRSGAT